MRRCIAGNGQRVIVGNADTVMKLLWRIIGGELLANGFACGVDEYEAYPE
jgi:hypothetical protein